MLATFINLETKMNPLQEAEEIPLGTLGVR